MGITLRCRRTFLEVVEHVETIEVGSSRRHSCSGLEGLQQAAWQRNGGRYVVANDGEYPRNITKDC